MLHGIKITLRRLRSRRGWTGAVLGLSLLVVPMAASAAPVQTVAAQPTGVEIKSPRQLERIPTAPVQAKVALNGAINPGSFKAWLNGRDVSKRFQVSGGQATASLDDQDGVRVSPDGKSWRSNVLLVSAHGRHFPFLPYHDARVFFVKAKSPVVSGIITPQGGSLNLPGIAQVTFPAGAFAANTRVQLWTTTDAAIQQKFSETTSSILGAQSRLPYELHVKTDGVQPLLEPQVSFTLPESFRSAVPNGSEVRVFAENFWDGPNGALDTFEVLPNRFLATDTTAQVAMPRAFFTDGLQTDGSFELITTVAATPTGTPATPVASAHSLTPPAQRPTVAETGNTPVNTRRSVAAAATTQQTDPCEGTTLDQPLDGTLEVTSPYGTRTHPITGVQTGHFGTDLRAADGTSVKAMADGVVEKVGNNVNTTPSGKTTGWGHYVVVRHTDGSKSLYAHLQSGTPVAEGTAVSAGDTIASSDTSGGATGPHLHIEYAPNGQIFDKSSKVDPMPCIGGNVTGSITVRDNGNLADDAFSVAIDGKVVCTTAIGASNTCAVGKLKPGTKTLTLTAVIAPDDVGTYEIILGDKLTFSNGSTQVSGVIPQGGSASYSIIVPASPPKP
jgi:murein DD-endopeptidase MepM/ murein hydrolase activator NlpD